ncbi:MAG TPA: trehalose-phosphatase [Nitrospiraceae bacterium]|nr:trehalose-phosphatase [Nitrospiraceae bacterium]
MRHVLSEEGRRKLRTLTTRSILYAFDFDGTLAGISSDRGAVKLSKPIHEWLSELARRVPCAIVSGRAISDLLPRVDGAVPHLIGNHGLESPLTPPTALSVAQDVCHAWMKYVDIDLAQSLKVAGVEVENKRYSLTFHYQRADESADMSKCKWLLELCRQLTPHPHCIVGKASVNLLPPGSTGKGEAALALMTHLRQSGLLFVGDDVTDEHVFGLTTGLVMGIRVGKHYDSRARFYLKRQEEIEDFIRFLIHRIDRTPEPAEPDDGLEIKKRRDPEKRTKSMSRY